MGLIASQSNLTVPDRAFESKRVATYPGMAHFATTGQPGKTCRECQSWTGCGGEKGYYANGGKHRGAIKNRSCAKYQEKMQGEVGPAVPHNAMACRYFEENPAPPSIIARS